MDRQRIQRLFITAVVSVFIVHAIVAQAVSISSDGTAPDTSAMLDIQSTTKGLLLPRVTTAQRMAIPLPATGLLVYDVETGSFWCYSGSAWIKIQGGNATLISDADGDTRVMTEMDPNEDRIRFEISGTEHFVMDGPGLHVRNSGSNVFLGDSAGVNTDLSVERLNVFVGDHAGYSTFYGFGNTGLGKDALYFNFSGNYNTAIGLNALQNNINGSQNTATGSSALRNNTGQNNTANGASALGGNTTGIYNTANGSYAMFANTTGDNNTANGASALFANRGNSRSTAIGYYAMYNADSRTTGRETFNTAVGFEALKGSLSSLDNTGRWNTAIGDQSLFSNSTGNWNTAAGADALRLNSTGSENTAIGRFSLYFNSSGSENIANGTYALYANSTGNYNVAIGNRSLFTNRANSGSTAIGYYAMYYADSSSTGQNTYNTAVGFGALRGGSNPGDNTGRWNTAVGDEALGANTSGEQNTAIGSSALLDNSIGYRNTAIGANTLSVNTSGYNNTAVGFGALFLTNTGALNVALGNRALENANGHRNVAAGTQALLSNTTGSRNSAIGGDAGLQNNGSDNVFLGFEAGRSNFSGSGNVFLGYQAGAFTSGDNQLVIHNNNSATPMILGNFNTLEMGINGKVGVGTYTPSVDLEVRKTDSPTVRIGSGNGNSGFLQLFEISGGNPFGYQLEYEGSSDKLYLWSKGFSGNEGIRMTWLKDGKVGIGTNTPARRLHVHTGSSGAGSNGSVVALFESATHTYISTLSNNASESGVLFGLPGSSAHGGIIYNNSAAPGGMSFRTGGNNTRMTILSDGKIGIGTTSPSYPLHMVSGARCTVGGTWVNASDGRLKKDVTPIGYDLQSVLALRPVSYRMRVTGEPQIGFIAQEVAEVIPELVSGFEGDPEQDEVLGLSYGNLTAVLVKAIQEQQEIIDKLTKRIDILESDRDGFKKELMDNPQFGKEIDSTSVDSKISNLVGQ